MGANPPGSNAKSGSGAAAPPRLVAILQARMGSNRLPGKVLAELCGRPMLHLILERLASSTRLQKLVVATTQLPQDDAIAELARRGGYPFYRGSENDVLDRYYQAARQQQADVVVRLTADCPFLDGAFLDWCLERFAASRPDYLDTNLSRTFPLGLSVEVFSFAALEAAWKEDSDPARREHVTPFIKQHPERFRLEHLRSAENYSSMRCTVDTPEDMALAREIYRRLGNEPTIAWQKVVALLQAEPQLLETNRHIVQKRLDSPKLGAS